MRYFEGFCVSVEICYLKMFLLATREYFEFGSDLSGPGWVAYLDMLLMFVKWHE